MEGMTDWNKLTMEQYIEHLENEFRFDSSGTAKAVFELIAAYKALTIHNVSKSFTAEDVVNELENSDHLDDAIQYFKEQIHKQ